MAPVQRKGLRALQIWCARVTSEYPNVNVIDLSTSFRDGLAFNAIIHHFRPHLFDYSKLDPAQISENNAHAFKIAEEHLNIPALLDPEDMVETDEPDKFSVATYLAQFYHLFKNESSPSGTPNSNNSSILNLSSSPGGIVKSPAPATRLSESEHDSMSVGRTSSSSSSASSTPITTRHNTLYNREQLIAKYGEDIFSNSKEKDSNSSGDEEPLNPRKIHPSRTSPKAVASVCKQFESLSVLRRS